MGLPPKAFFVPILKSNLLVQYGSSLAFQSFHDFLGILRLDSHFFQGDAKVLEEHRSARRSDRDLWSGHGRHEYFSLYTLVRRGAWK